jgi:hypothetical protein
VAAKVELLGESAVREALAGVERDVTLYGKVGKEAAVLVAATAASYGPNVSGKLAASYKGFGGKTQGRVVSRAKNAKGRTDKTAYAPVIEYGWPAHNIAPQMRVRRALKAKEPQIRALFEEYIRNSLRARGVLK